MAQRPQIKGYLNEPGARAWDRLVTREGVSTSALLAALADELAAGKWRPTRRMIDRAKRIDRERDSRR